MILTLFDFDGTITKKDSLVDFIQFAVGKPKYYIGLLKLSPMLLVFSLKLIPNYIAKEKLISYFFKNLIQSDFDKLAYTYSIGYLDQIVRPLAMEKIKWHQEQGHHVVIVSASMECWLKPWCNKNNLQLLATKLEVIDKKLTGKFLTKNCHGAEKVNQIKKSYNLSDYDYIYVYGDSSGDQEMLALADESFYKPFRD
jgi:phosphatidylglycerophosphatase C